MSKSAYAEEIADLLKQAEETLRGGDPDSARMIFEAVLQIDPENEPAQSGIERALAAPPPAADCELSIDFELAASAPTAPPRPAPPPASRPAPEPEAIVDLIEAADLLPTDENPAPAPAPGTAAGREAEGEAALMAEQARRHLFRGDLARATEFASRALAMDEGCDAAQDVLEEARTESARRASTAERLISDAIAAIERSYPAQAIPMLQQVLGLVPEHPEALEWLARARQAVQESHGRAAATAETGPTLGFTPTSLVSPPPPAPPIPSIPQPSPSAPPAASSVAPVFQSNATPEPAPAPSPASAGRYAAGVAKDRVPVDTPLAVAATAKPARAPIAVSGQAVAEAEAEATAAETTAPTPPPEMTPPPLPRPASGQARARPLTAKAAKAARASLGRRLANPLAVLLTLGVLGVGGWWLGGMLGWWGADPRAAAGTEQAVKSKPKKVAPAQSAPQLTKADVPRLLTEGKLAVARGDEKTGFALIRQAAQLDPAHAEAKALAAKVEHAIAARADADDRHTQLVRSYNDHDFASVLRILYRLPKEEQPADLNRAIANASFNLGLQMMRGGDPYGAREYLRDALERRPGDAEAKRLLELSKQYRNRARDEAYFTALAEPQFRPLE